MKSIREIYKIGKGPSSSHTMGPEKACKIFRAEHPLIDNCKAILYGSLADTGRGHGTDRVIKETLSPIPCEIIFDLETKGLPHENTMDLIGYKDGIECGSMRIMSVGGGDIKVLGRNDINIPEV